jgi:hypothetical protein
VAIGVAVVQAALYLGLNAVVVASSIIEAFAHPLAVADWWRALSGSHRNPFTMVGFALLVFPKLALGLSGFEAGVAVMPGIRGDVDDTETPG